MQFSEMDETQASQPTVASAIQPLNSYASSSSSSGVVANFPSKSLSQNLSCDSSRSNFSTFESLDLNLSDCSDLASSLPSCASGNVNEGEHKDDGKTLCSSITSTSNAHPCVYVSLSGKTPCSFLRNNPIGHPTCRAVTRSPVDFRQGRRASDGLVAQGLANQVDNNTNSVAFNSQRLHEACKAKGVLELHLLQQEAASLSSQYQSYVPQEELNVRQREHSQFYVTPIKSVNEQNTILFQCGYKYEDMCYYNKTVNGDVSSYVGMMKNNDYGKLENGELAKQMSMKSDGQSSQQQGSAQKPPLQQQLMQHRLLQQKRQILQKQGAMETCLSRRQMLRQQSYKMAQNQQILPPLPFPLTEKESEDLLAFQKIVENPNSPTSSSQTLCSNLLKTTYLHNNNSTSPATSPQPQPSENGAWNNLPSNLQSSCQISEVTATHEIFHQQLYHQVTITSISINRRLILMIFIVQFSHTELTERIIQHTVRH